MAKPKDPADSPVTQPPTSGAKPASGEPPADPTQGLALNEMIEVIATAAAQMQGLKGAELKDEVRDLVSQVQHVAKDIELKVAVDETRKQTVSEVQRLLDVMMQAGQNASKVIGPHRDAIAQMFRHIDFEKMSAGLQLIHEYLQTPNAVTEDKIKRLMGDLESTMGPLVNYDPARDEEQRREALKQDVQARLDKIFKNTSYKPDVSNLAPPLDLPAKKKPE